VKSLQAVVPANLFFLILMEQQQVFFFGLD